MSLKEFNYLGGENCRGKTMKIPHSNHIMVTVLSVEIYSALQAAGLLVDG